MTKHARGKTWTMERKTPPRKPARKPPPTVIPAPTPSSSSSLELAARRVLSATPHALDHLEYAPGCPFSAGGACICGRNELLEALGALKTALEGSA